YSRIRLLLHCVSTVMSSTDTSTLSLHDALPILEGPPRRRGRARHHRWGRDSTDRGGGRHADGQPDRAAGARRGGTRRARVAPRLRPVAAEDLAVAPGLLIPAAELEERFSTSGGPGGQHANRARTRVELRFDVAGSAALTERQRALLRERVGDEVVVVA